MIINSDTTTISNILIEYKRGNSIDQNKLIDIMELKHIINNDERRKEAKKIKGRQRDMMLIAKKN